MKLMSPAKRVRIVSPAIIFLALTLGFCACSQQEPVVVETGDNDFPVVHVANPHGKKITMQPVSAEIGSIGFEKDSTITWIKGEATRTVGAEETNYSWPINTEDKVQLKVTKDKEEVNLHLSLVSAGNGQPPNGWHINTAAVKDEYFTGLFERVVDGEQNNSWAKGVKTALNLRNERVEIKLKPTVSAYAPFYLSSNHYGFFVKGTWPGVFDFCREHPDVVQVTFEGPDLNFKIYPGVSLKRIVQTHALETGPSIVPPQWALGPWRWRDEHWNNKKYFDSTAVKAPFNSDLVEDVLLMKAYDIPCTAYWIDRPWGPGVRGFDDYEFDLQRFPQPEEMVKWLNQNGIELMMWISPFVMGKMADYAEDNGYFLESNVWRDSRQILMDFSNPEACTWWAENGPGKLARMGIKGFKLDRADGEKLRDYSANKTFAGLTYRQNYNDYPRQYVKAAYDALKPILGDNFLLFPRAQYTGSAKYGGLWAGDTGGIPEGLRSAVIGMQRCAIMGYPIWGSDIGGYWGGFSHETCMRWLGFGCFSPLMEVGPTENRGFWNNVEAPHHDPDLIATWRLYTKTRMKLISYLQDLAEEARATGTPIVRPLFLEYPEQQPAWEDWQTYLLGPDILVSIIWEPGKTSQRLYLPAGETWVDAWDKKEHAGGKYIEVEAPPFKTPIFLRQGTSLDLGDLNALYNQSLEMARQKYDLAELEAKEGWR